MYPYPYLAQLLAEERRQREQEEARQSRLAASLPRSSQPRQFRGAIGRSLIRLGQRLSEAEPSFGPARQR